jgi:hypothetical protein
MHVCTCIFMYVCNYVISNEVVIQKYAGLMNHLEMFRNLTIREKILTNKY